jgi:hypothetical protein
MILKEPVGILFGYTIPIFTWRERERERER